MSKPDKVTAIEKALSLLMAFVPHNEERGTTDLSDQLQFHKATTSRILRTLVEHGFLQQNSATKKFSLGRSIQALSTALTTSLTHNLVQIAQPHVDALRNQIGEDVGLEVWSGSGTTWVYAAENDEPLRISNRQGHALPFHAAAGAKAILAFTAPHTLDSLLSQELPRLTPATLTDPSALRQQLQEFQQQGYAVDREEVRTGISALGAPIFNHEGKPFAAVVVIIPTQRLIADPDSPIVRALKETAAAISALYFYEETR